MTLTWSLKDIQSGPQSTPVLCLGSLEGGPSAQSQVFIKYMIVFSQFIFPQSLTGLHVQTAPDPHSRMLPLDFTVRMVLWCLEWRPKGLIRGSDGPLYQGEASIWTVCHGAQNAVMVDLSELSTMCTQVLLSSTWVTSMFFASLMKSLP